MRQVNNTNKMSVPAQFLLCDTVFDRLTRRHCLQVSAKTAVHSLLTKQVLAYLLVRLMTVLLGTQQQWNRFTVSDEILQRNERFENIEHNNTV